MSIQKFWFVILEINSLLTFVVHEFSSGSILVETWFHVDIIILPVSASDMLLGFCMV